MRLRRPLSVLAALAVGAATVSIGSPALAADDPAPIAGPDGYTPPPITWTDCSEQYSDGFECGRVVVPLDWSQPSGETVSLAVTRLRHTIEPYQGVMLVNPGGPGGSGTVFAALRDAVPNDGGQSYDWIGFDPRGVGQSTPRINCIETFTNGVKPPYVPSTKKIERAWIAKTKAYAAACGARNGAILQRMTTIDAARDMDAIRAALGQAQLNYYGFSYGTYLGQVYGTLFPSHVRRMVFDSTVDPRGVWYQDGLDQTLALQKVADAWFSWLAKYDRVYHLGKTRAKVAARYAAEMRALDKRPRGSVGGSEWTDIFVPVLYTQASWEVLGDVFTGWARHRDKALLQAAYQAIVETDDDNGLAAFDAVTCTDAPLPVGYAGFKRDATRLNKKAPFIAWPSAWFSAACLYWPAKAGTPADVVGSGVESVLMIDETLDGPTPYSGSIAVRRLFPGARLIAEPGGTSHANTLAGNSCVDDQIAAYLADGTLPERRAGNGPDAVCAPLPKPVPTAVSPSARSAYGARQVLLQLKTKADDWKWRIPR